MSSTPFISVVIAARNEAHNILECLTDMLKQEYPHGHFEVIIADDHSEDNTVDLCRKFIASHPDLAITLDARPGSEKGKKAALARAISRSNGELILATDADTTSW